MAVLALKKNGALLRCPVAQRIGMAGSVYCLLLRSFPIASAENNAKQVGNIVSIGNVVKDRLARKD